MNPIKYLFAAFSLLFIVGCEDLNTFCPKDINDSNNSDINCSDINCTNYCRSIDWNDLNKSNTGCIESCNCKAEPVPGLDCSKSYYSYCKVYKNDQNRSDYYCSDTPAFTETCHFSECSCKWTDDNGSIERSCACGPLSSGSTGSEYMAGDGFGSNGGYWNGSDTETPDSSQEKRSYILHSDIRAEVFSIGTSGGKSDTAWDGHWADHAENSFYASLPYNDLDETGERKLGSDSYIPWATDDDSPYQSICKNRWIKIVSREKKKTAYAQWEDVGPAGSTDANYVFGTSRPNSSADKNASAIALSPKLRDYLLNSDANHTTVEWKFIEESSVPGGPWKKTVTTAPSN